MAQNSVPMIYLYIHSLHIAYSCHMLNPSLECILDNNLFGFYSTIDASPFHHSFVISNCHRC